MDAGFCFYSLEDFRNQSPSGNLSYVLFETARSPKYGYQRKKSTTSMRVYSIHHPLLHAVQLLSDIGQEDSKTFVDCSLKEDPIVIRAAFLALSKPYTKVQLNTFIDTFFQHSTKIVCERDGSSMH